MLNMKNNKSIIRTIALVLVLVMAMALCLTGCSDATARSAAEAAQADADTAISKADTAQAAANDAKAAADAAKAAADAAAGSTTAGDAATQATAAKTAAETAQTAATTAQTTAETAVTNAAAAQTAADEAKTAAETAQTAAEEAMAAIEEQAEDWSAATEWIAEEGMKELVLKELEIEATKDDYTAEDWATIQALFAAQEARLLRTMSLDEAKAVVEILEEIVNEIPTIYTEAGEVEVLVKALPDPVTTADEDAIEAARAAFEEWCEKYDVEETDPVAKKAGLDRLIECENALEALEILYGKTYEAGEIRDDAVYTAETKSPDYANSVNGLLEALITAIGEDEDTTLTLVELGEKVAAKRTELAAISTAWENFKSENSGLEDDKMVESATYELYVQSLDAYDFDAYKTTKVSTIATLLNTTLGYYTDEQIRSEIRDEAAAGIAAINAITFGAGEEDDSSDLTEAKSLVDTAFEAAQSALEAYEPEE